MSTKGLQRTLLVGMGQIGAQTADRLLAELRHQLGPVPILQSLAVLTEDMPLQTIETPVMVSAGAAFEDWREAFEQQVNAALYHISQLDHLPYLARHNIILRRPDEIHIIVMTNPTEAWTTKALPQLTAALRQTVDQTLNCYTGLSGVLLAVRLPGSEPGETDPLPPVTDILKDVVAVDQFDRGCFLAGQTNEVGLYIGDAAYLIQRAVQFLMVLITEDALIGGMWADDRPAGWGVPLTTFGLAAIHWPGPALVDILTKRWARAMLSDLTSLPANNMPKVDLAQQARTAAQQWLTGHKLPPPLLIEQCATSMPPLPNRLDGLVPDPPWPWLLVDARSVIEQAAHRWYDDWLVAGREQISAYLTHLETEWDGQAQTWLDRQAGQRQSGTVLIIQSYMAAVSELLTAFVEGVEQHLEEAQVDLIRVEQQLSDVSEALSHALASLPSSSLVAIFKWGLRPLRWPRYWAQCRQVQSIARNFAHLSRGRLMALQHVWYYEEILPFYKAIQQSWRQVVARWEQACKAVLAAARSPVLTGWADEVEAVLDPAAGPWHLSLAAYQSTVFL
ncbi:MAG: hypothetical protein GY792_09360 [Gammaproteobacteria bacterium]|nr:hypothetical protein [Gammaproteobacteria bacterium]